MTVILALIAIAFLLIFVHNVKSFNNLPWLDASEQKKTSVFCPSVSIIVAARNEADIIERTLVSLQRIDYPDFEIILINDQSSDDTAEIAALIAAKDSRLSIIDSEDLPSGWIGKSWALHQGVKHARGEWLLFTDADCIHHPQSLRIAMTLVFDSELDFVSIIPKLEQVNSGGKLIMPAYVTLLGTFFPLGKLNVHPNKALAAGGFILVKRSIYQAVGGHFAIRGSLLDDVSLACRVKAFSYSVWTGLTRDLVVTRPYESLKAIWIALGRHAFDLMERSVMRVIIFLIGLMLMVGLPMVGLVVSAVSMSPLVLILAMVSMGIMILVGIGSTKLLGIGWLWGLILPIGFLLYGGIVVTAVVQFWRGKLVWSGRQYGR